MSQQKVVLDNDVLQVNKLFAKRVRVSDIKDIAYIHFFGIKSFRLMLGSGWLSFRVYSNVLEVEDVMRDVSCRTNLPIYLQNSLNPLNASVWYQPPE